MCVEAELKQNGGRLRQTRMLRQSDEVEMLSRYSTYCGGRMGEGARGKGEGGGGMKSNH